MFMKKKKQHTEQEKKGEKGSLRKDRLGRMKTMDGMLQANKNNVAKDERVGERKEEKKQNKKQKKYCVCVFLYLYTIHKNIYIYTHISMAGDMAYQREQRSKKKGEVERKEGAPKSYKAKQKQKNQDFQI